MSNKYVVKADYSFAVDGGAQGTITTDSVIPAGAIVTAVYLDVDTPVTSGGAATIAIKGGSTTLVAATALASWADGKLTLNGSADFIKVTSQGFMSFVIGTADLTAGVWRVGIEYMLF